jgi:mannitol/fructose-specific phosphotransferase system IIA component (Ntr-type)
MFENLKREAVMYIKEPLDKEEALNRIIFRACEVFRIPECDSILSSIIDRESKLSTGIGLGVAVPHCRSEKVQKITTAIMLTAKGIEYNSVDGQPVRLIFLIISPVHDVQGHIACLSTISHAVSDEETRKRLMNSRSDDELFENLQGVQTWA